MCARTKVQRESPVLSQVQAAMPCSEHLSQSVKCTQSKVCESTAQFQILAEKVNGIYNFNPRYNVIRGLRRQRRGARKVSHPGDSETVTAEDIFMCSGQRHRLYLPKCRSPSPHCGCLQCSLPVDRKKVFSSC